MVAAGDRSDRGRPVRAARRRVARGRGGVRGRGRPPGPRHRLGAAGAPRRGGPRGRHRRGSSPRCCRPTRAMLRVFADAGYQVERQYADGVVHLSFPIAPTERSLRGAVGPRAPHRGALDRPAARPARRRRLRRQRHRARASARRCSATCATAGSPAPIVPGAPDRRRRWPGCRRTRRAAERRAASTWRVVAVPPAGGRRGGRRRGRRRRARPGRGLRRLRRGRPGRRGGAAGAGPGRPRWPGMRVVGPNCLGIANTDPAVRLNATLAPRLPAAGPGRLLQPVRRARRGAAGRGGPARARPVQLRLGRQPRRRLRQRPAAVLARRPAAPTWSCSTWRRSATRASSPGWPAGSAGPSRSWRSPRRPARPASATRRPWTPPRSRALFAQSGVIRVDTVAELFDVGVLLANQPLPAGRRVGVVGNSSALTGAGRRAPAPASGAAPSPTATRATSAREAGAHELRRRARRRRRRRPAWTRWSWCSRRRCPASSHDADADFAAALASVALAAGQAGGGDVPGSAAATRPRVPAYPAVEEAVRALARVAAYADWRREPAGRAARAVRRRPGGRRRSALTPAADAPALLAAYGIDVVPSAAGAAAERGRGRRRPSGSG